MASGTKSWGKTVEGNPQREGRSRGGVGVGEVEGQGILPRDRAIL